MHVRSSRELLLRVALSAVGLHELLAFEFGREIFAPVGLRHIPGQGIGPGFVFAVAVLLLEASSLSAVTHGAAEVGEFVAAFPMAVALHVAEPC